MLCLNPRRAVLIATMLCLKPRRAVLIATMLCLKPRRAVLIAAMLGLKLRRTVHAWRATALDYSFTDLLTVQALCRFTVPPALVN